MKSSASEPGLNVSRARPLSERSNDCDMTKDLGTKASNLKSFPSVSCS